MPPETEKAMMPQRTQMSNAGRNYQDILISFSSINFAFNGQWNDVVSNLYYLRNRYYDCFQGRFITNDPFGIWKDLSNYGAGKTYCGNNPVYYFDSIGLLTVEGVTTELQFGTWEKQKNIGQPEFWILVWGAKCDKGDLVFLDFYGTYSINYSSTSGIINSDDRVVKTEDEDRFSDEMTLEEKNEKDETVTKKYHKMGFYVGSSRLSGDEHFSGKANITLVGTCKEGGTVDCSPSCPNGHSDEACTHTEAERQAHGKANPVVIEAVYHTEELQLKPFEWDYKYHGTKKIWERIK